MKEIPIEKLIGHENARPGAALVRSMQEQGHLPAFPIAVSAEQEGRYEILDGRRRTAAAVKVGLESVPAVVIAAGDNGAGAALTILAHATRSENPVAELKAYQALMRAGMNEKEIARAGYATLARVRRIGKLNKLIPPIAARVERGEVAPGVAFQIVRLAPEVQENLAREEKITRAVVRKYRAARRQATVLAVPGLSDVLTAARPATVEDVLAALSVETLRAILNELPEEERLVIWRGKIRRALAMSSVRVERIEQFLPQTI